MPILWSACVFSSVSLDVVQSIIMWVHYMLGPLFVYLFIMFAVFKCLYLTGFKHLQLFIRIIIIMYSIL